MKISIAGFDFLHCLAHVEGDRASLRVRHQAFGAEDFTQASDGLHHVRGSDQGVEVSPVLFVDLLDHLFAANVVRARVLRFFDFVAAGDHEDLLGFSQSVGQDDCPAHHLVSMLGIDSQPHGDFHGLVKF